MKNILEAEMLVDGILDNMILEQEQKSDSVTMEDISDLLEELKKQGFTDKKKLQSSLNRANEIAREQGKAGDKKTVVGIFSRFFRK